MVEPTKAQRSGAPVPPGPRQAPAGAHPRGPSPRSARHPVNRAWAPEPPKTIRSFTCVKNLAAQVWEIHLRGVKVAQVSIFDVAKSSTVLDSVVDQLHNVFHRELKFLDAHPEAVLAPAGEGDPACEVESLEDLG